MTVRRMTWLAPTVFLVLAGCSGANGTDAAADANPCAANPCAANPCAANADGSQDLAEKIQQGDKKLDAHGKTDAQLVALGADLWKDASLRSDFRAALSAFCSDGQGSRWYG